MLEDGDYICYCDAGSYYINDVRLLAGELNKLNQPVLPFCAGYREKYFTKRDLFIFMGCDTPEITESWQVMATCFFIKKSSAAIDFFEEFLDIAQTGTLVTDAPSELGTEYDEFIENRHDQSIFSLLCKKKGFEIFREPIHGGPIKRKLKNVSQVIAVLTQWKNKKISDVASIPSVYDKKTIENILNVDYQDIIVSFRRANPAESILRNSSISFNARDIPLSEIEKLRGAFADNGWQMSNDIFNEFVLRCYILDAIKGIGRRERTFSEYKAVRHKLREQNFVIPTFKEIAWFVKFCLLGL